MRVVRFLFRNWPLKLGAILLAIMLYVVMVALQNTQVWPGQVAIEPINQPASAVLLDPNPLPLVSNIRYVAPPEVAALISRDSFTATIDLSQVHVSKTVETSQIVNVQLVANDNRIQILDYSPQQIRVTLDPLVHKTVPIKVAYGVVPQGLTIATPVISPAEAVVSGPNSIVTLVTAAQARVGIDASGLDVNQTVDLVALDAQGNALNGVEFDPRSAQVKIQVGSQLRTATVPVDPVVVGTPASGFVISSIDVTPSVVQVQGEADALANLKGKASTAQVSIAGATGDVTKQVGLDLPSGVEAAAAARVTVVVHLVSPAATRTLSVAVAIAGAQSNRIYSLSTPSILVTLSGQTASLNALDTSALVATADVSALGPGSHAVPVSVNVPPGIRVVSQSVAQVTVTVSVPPTPVPSPSPSPVPSPT